VHPLIGFDIAGVLGSFACTGRIESSDKVVTTIITAAAASPILNNDTVLFFSIFPLSTFKFLIHFYVISL